MDLDRWANLSVRSCILSVIIAMSLNLCSVVRYAGALVLGYREYHRQDPPHPPLYPGTVTRRLLIQGVLYEYDESPYPYLATPRLAALALVVAGAFVWFVAVASKWAEPAVAPSL